MSKETKVKKPSKIKGFLTLCAGTAIGGGAIAFMNKRKTGAKRSIIGLAFAAFIMLGFTNCVVGSKAYKEAKVLGGAGVTKVTQMAEERKEDTLERQVDFLEKENFELKLKLEYANKALDDIEKAK